ncbi:hypothetical protein OF83DRAFT_519402 [Amylostereum chailletii]|nr:hypothetical protein OF83DRAFT_519402 [Amylostereum chailletii]
MFHQSLSSHYAAADTAGLVFLSGKITFEDDLTFLANEACIHRPSGQCLDECDADQNGHPPSLGELKLCLDDPDHESLPLFRALFTLPVFQNLRTLDISCWDFLTDGAEWHRVFDTLQNVVSLTVHGCESRVWVSMDERDVASAADGLVSAFDVDDDQSHLFPKLERLRVCYVDFVPEHCEYVTLPFCLALQVGLLARVEAGPASVTPLRLLEIYRCSHYLPVVRVLKRMFSDLVVEVV